MGTLYVGKHLQTGRRAAIKVIEYGSAEALARFRLEASVCAQIAHPGIVDVFDADLDDATACCFIAMELLEGRTLRDVMDDPASTPQQVIELLLAALPPLAAAHAKGFVHRDLKPENLFVLDQPTGDTRVKLLDFGIAARAADERLTRAGMAMGTPHYMSPEQATSAREAGSSSDVWSLGVMIYEAVRGEVPFNAETGHGVIVQVCTCPHMPLDQAAQGVDPAIARLVDRCLSKAPADRPANAQALMNELRGLLRPNSLPAARPSLRARPSVQQISTTQNASGVRPSLRTRSVMSSANLLTASGVACTLSAVGLMIAGVASPAPALLCAAVGGGLLYTASARMKALQALLQPPANQNAARVPATVVLSERPKRLLHPMRGAPGASVRVELYADLTDAISRRACQRVMNLRLEHPDDVSVVWKPYWDPQRDIAPLAAEVARALFEREGPEIFWAFFDRMLSTSKRVTEGLLYDYVAEVCPDMYGFHRAIRAHLHRRGVQQCREEAESVGIDHSPALVINGAVLAGEVSEDRLHWAFVDAKSGVERRRNVEMGATHAGQPAVERVKAVRGLLIRYQGARNAPPALRRTRAEARERAEKLLGRARMEGADFNLVALRFSDQLLESEDLMPRLEDPIFYDAVSKLAIGDLTPPLECDEGFQVVQRTE
jgi:predicted DsbA family dithiol-disulfide isomerase